MRPLRPLGFDRCDAPVRSAATDRERPAAYVSFGTEFGAVAPWRAVIEAIEAVDVDALCTVGSAMNPSSLERLPRGVRVERWVPQSAAIAAADVVISHGGSGTVIGATAAGRPQLVLPIGADQFDNADLVHERGLGLALEPEDVTPESIGRSLRRLIDSVSIRARATAGAAEIAAMPPPDVAVELIEQLV